MKLSADELGLIYISMSSRIERIKETASTTEVMQNQELFDKIYAEYKKAYKKEGLAFK